MFRGVLSVSDRCACCGLDLSAADVGDGYVVPTLLVLGSIVVGLAFWVDFTWQPPLWVHALIWPVVTLGLALAMIRWIKAFLIAQQYHVRPGEME